MLLSLEIITLAVWSQSLLLVSLLLPIVGATGFAFGILYERWHQASKLERVRKRFEKLFEHVNALLSQTERACAALDEQLPANRLSDSQKSQLTGTTSRLTQRLQELVETAGSHAVSGVTSVKMAVGKVVPRGTSRSAKPPRWIRIPVDQRTELPDYVAYARNLELLQQYGQKQGPDLMGILYVRLDRYTQHQNRLGEEVANNFVKQTAALVLAQMGKDDVLCQITDDLLVGLLATEGASIRTAAEAARKTIRNHQFLHPQTQEAVFVTASFGFTRFDEHLLNARDFEQAIYHRGQVALQASAKHGRCQLHEITPAGSSRLIVG